MDELVIIALCLMWIVGILTCIAAYKSYKSSPSFPNRLKIRNRYNEKKR